MRKRSRYARYLALRQAPDPMAAFKLIGSVAARQSKAPLDRSQLMQLALGYHGALAQIVAGKGTFDDANTLAATANLTILLCEAGLGHDEIATALAGRDAAVSCQARHKRTGVWGLAGLELGALNAMLMLHDAQLESEDCTEGLMMAALTECADRIRKGQVVGAEA